MIKNLAHIALCAFVGFTLSWASPRVSYVGTHWRTLRRFTSTAPSRVV